MTRTELREALNGSVTQSFVFACHALGIGETAGRQSLKRGDFPVRVIRVGMSLRVPSVELERVLLLTDELAAVGDGAA